MERQFKMTRTVDKNEQPWMRDDDVVHEGETVWEWLGHDYGCISDGGIAVSRLRGKTPCFQVPADSVQQIQ